MLTNRVGGFKVVVTLPAIDATISSGRLFECGNWNSKLQEAKVAIELNSIEGYNQAIKLYGEVLQASNVATFSGSEQANAVYMQVSSLYRQAYLELAKLYMQSAKNSMTENRYEEAYQLYKKVAGACQYSPLEGTALIMQEAKAGVSEAGYKWAVLSLEEARKTVLAANYEEAVKLYRTASHPWLYSNKTDPVWIKAQQECEQAELLLAEHFVHIARSTLDKKQAYELYARALTIVPYKFRDSQEWRQVLSECRSLGTLKITIKTFSLVQ